MTRLRSSPPVGAAAAPLLSRNQYRFHQLEQARRTGVRPLRSVLLLVLAGLAYNGLLAFLNARGFPVGRPLVVVTEIMILSGVAMSLFASGPRETDYGPALFLAFFLLDALAVSVFNGSLFVEMARNASIIALFTMLGMRTSADTLRRCFLISAILVAVVLAIEIASVSAYASLFAPGAYFSQTRGISPAEFDDLGLFGNALGFDDRFSILHLIDHRASSIFLEQVSLANFAVVLAIYLTCRWRQVPRGQAIFFMALIALMLVTTNSRAALALTLCAPFVYVIAPRLNRYATLLVMPVVLLVSLLITLSAPPTDADVVQGRLGLTIRSLRDMDLSALAGFKASLTPHFADSGYAYLIYASSLVGLIAMWLFASLVAVRHSPSSRRCALYVALYVFSNFMVSGTSIFSIKTAALLWLLVGYIRSENQESATDQALRDATVAQRSRLRPYPAMERARISA